MLTFITSHVGMIVGLIVLAIVIIFFAVGYLKAPPDVAYIISGLRATPRILVGKSGFRIPFIERVDKLPLKLMQVDIKTDSVPTEEYINIYIDGVANVRVGQSDEDIRTAARNFLYKSDAEISTISQQVLEGNMREIIGKMKLSELVHDRDTFAMNIQNSATPEMKAMGLEVVNLTIQSFSDENKVIENLGMDNITQIKKSAAIAKANGERDIQIATAKAQEEANKASTDSKANIAQQNTDLLIKQAELKKRSDTKQAEADAAYQIQKNEQEKSLNIAKANAELAMKEREVEIKNKEIDIQERQLDASVRKKADADRYAAQQEADADLYRRQKAAEAEKYEVIQSSESEKVKADALKYAKEQEAAGIRAIGDAEAEAILKKAEAMKQMGEASILEMYLNTLPEIVKNAASPLASTEKIVMYGDGNAPKLVGDVMKTTSQVVDGLRESTGIDLQEILNGIHHKTITLDKSSDVTQ